MGILLLGVLWLWCFAAGFDFVWGWYNILLGVVWVVVGL